MTDVNKEIEQGIEKVLVSYDKLALSTGFSKDLISIAHKTVAKGTTLTEFAYFLQYCKSVGLNPINKEVWCYKNGSGDLVMFAGHDGFMKKAHESNAYLGMRSSDVCEFDEFEIDMIEGKVNHKITNNRGPIVGAYAIVKVKGREDTIKYIDFKEFDLQQALWKKKPKKMICKVAETHALKEAFGVVGLYIEDEFKIKDGLIVEDIAHEIVDKSEERMLLLIDAVDTLKKLEPLQKNCKTQETRTAYDKKHQELSVK